MVSTCISSFFLTFKLPVPAPSNRPFSVDLFCGLDSDPMQLTDRRAKNTSFSEPPLDFSFEDNDDVFFDALLANDALKRKQVSPCFTDANAPETSAVDDAIHPSTKSTSTQRLN